MQASHETDRKRPGAGRWTVEMLFGGLWMGGASDDGFKKSQ